MLHDPESSMKEVFLMTDFPMTEAHCFKQQDFSLLKPFKFKFEQRTHFLVILNSLLTRSVPF